MFIAGGKLQNKKAGKPAHKLGLRYVVLVL